MKLTQEEKEARAKKLTKDLPPMLTSKEVIEFFRVGRSTLNDWIANGDLPGALKVGREWRIPKDDIVELAIGMYGEKED